MPYTRERQAKTSGSRGIDNMATADIVVKAGGDTYAKDESRSSKVALVTGITGQASVTPHIIRIGTFME